MAHNDEDEILDVVNENDDTTGTIRRGDAANMERLPNSYLRFVEIFIQRSNGDIYLPRRSQDKKIAPGGLDISAAGHVMHNESYEEACEREVNEETGIKLNPGDLTLIATIPPSKNIPIFRKLYLLHTDLAPRLSPEHIGATWVQPGKLSDAI